MMAGLDLIDWRLVAFSALWILGASILLATFSFGYFVARERRTRTRAVLRGQGYQVGLYGGLALFALGMAGGAGTWWEALIWAVLALLFTYWTLRQAGRRESPPASRSPGSEPGG
jgi:hypothetical protein